MNWYGMCTDSLDKGHGRILNKGAVGKGGDCVRLEPEGTAWNPRSRALVQALLGG